MPETALTYQHTFVVSEILTDPVHIINLGITMIERNIAPEHKLLQCIIPTEPQPHLPFH